MTIAIGKWLVSGSTRPIRYRSLDLWRGIACLAVIVFHACEYDLSKVGQLLQPLRHGVTLFFVISGYCIAASTWGSVGSIAYFTRRFRRIFPPYWALVLGTVTLGLVLYMLGVSYLFTDGIVAPDVAQTRLVIPLPWQLNAWQWLGNLSLTEMWRSYVAWRGGQRFFVGHAWTLCYEEQFYAVMGALLFVARRHQAIGVAVVSALVLLIAPYTPMGFFFDGRWLVFAIGVAVFYWRNKSPLFTISAIGILTALVLVRMPTGEIWTSIAIGAPFAVLLVAIRGWDEQLISTRWTLPLQACGIRCYSIYLVHAPITKLIAHVFAERGVSIFVTILCCLIVSLLIAWPFHAYVERRFMRSAPARDHVVTPGYSISTSQRDEPVAAA